MAGKRTETIYDDSQEHILRDIRRQPMEEYLALQRDNLLEIARDYGETARLRCEALFRTFAQNVQEVDARYLDQFDRLARSYRDDPNPTTAEQFKVLVAAMEGELMAERRAFGNLIRAAVLGERVQ